MNNLEGLEDIFEGIGGTQKALEPQQKSSFDLEFEQQSEFKTNSSKHITKEFIDYYSMRRDLLEPDIESGIIPEDLASDLRKAVYAYPEIEQDNSSIYESGESQSKAKQKLKTNATGVLHQSYEIGFAEPLLLGLVVSSLGLLYLGYLYLVI